MLNSDPLRATTRGIKAEATMINLPFIGKLRTPVFRFLDSIL